MKYPYIIYPTLYNKQINRYPSLPVEPIKPIKPQMPRAFVHSSGLGPSGYLLIPAAVFIFYSLNQTILLIPAVTAFLFIFIYALVSSVNSDDIGQKLYKENLRIYYIDLNIYNKELERYPDEYEEWLSISLAMSTDQYIDEYRYQTFRGTVETTVKSRPSQKTVKSGVSEQYFTPYLLEAFGSNVLFKQEVVTHKGIYYPDFVVTDSIKKIYIDIEIDEPYIGSNGEPIHYFNIDQKRNLIFSEMNWMVIRFAEEQVIKNPKECCNLIKSAILSLEGYSPTIINQNVLQEVNIWSFKEAASMAFRKYRHSYLPLNLQSLLSSETFESETIVFDERIDEWKHRLPFEESKYIGENDDLPF